MIQVQAQVHGQNRALDPDQNQNRKMAKRKSVHTHHHLLHRLQKRNRTNIPINQRIRNTDMGRKNQRKDYGIRQKIDLSHIRSQREDQSQMIPTGKILPKDGKDQFQLIDMKAADMEAVDFLHHHRGRDLLCLIGTPEKAGDLAQGIEENEVLGGIDVIVPGQLPEDCQILGQGVESKDLRGGTDVIIPDQFPEGDPMQGQYIGRIVFP